MSEPLPDWVRDLATSRPPDVLIGGKENPYLRRWWVVPRNTSQNIYLHHFLRSDDDRALHSHPWEWNSSLILHGRYLEHTPTGIIQRHDGEFIHRVGEAWHRIELTDGPVWTLFLTGPIVREWGFDCPQGFVHWKDFTASDDPGAIGRGCDQ